MILRTFYPVGHGAFYSENHLCGSTTFNIVYDCGTLESKSLVSTIVKDAFSDDEVIDILFISHFDKDHVSLIPELRPFRSRKIKKVVLPLLHHDVKLLLNGYYRLMNGWWSKADIDIILTILNKPEELFSGAELIFVSSDNDEKVEFHQDIVDGTHIKSGCTVKSGTAILLKKHPEWVFIPYNLDISNRVTNLKSLLMREGIDINSLKDANFVNNYSKKLKTLYKTFRTKNKVSPSSILTKIKVVNIVRPTQFSTHCIEFRECEIVLVHTKVRYSNIIINNIRICRDIDSRTRL